MPKTSRPINNGLTNGDSCTRGPFPPTRALLAPSQGWRHTAAAAIRSFPSLLSFPVPQVLYTEVVSNPTLRVADIRALADLAHSHVVRERGQEGRQGAAGGDGGAAAAAPSPRVCQLVVDNTFTPLVVTPKRLGADVVVHRWVQVHLVGASGGQLAVGYTATTWWWQRWRWWCTGGVRVHPSALCTWWGLVADSWQSVARGRWWQQWRWWWWWCTRYVQLRLVAGSGRVQLRRAGMVLFAVAVGCTLR